MRVIKLILLGFAGLVVLIFSMQNRHMVPFQWNPFASPDLELGRTNGLIELPMFLYVIIILSIGIAIGVFMEWCRESKHRSAARASQAETTKLRAEVKRLYSENV